MPMHRTLVTVAAAGLTAGLFAFTGSLTAQDTPASSQPAEAATFGVDAGHSGVVFNVKHLGVANFYGRFNAISGEYAFDPAVDGGWIRIEVPSESIDTNSAGRDRHLKSPDFFNVKQFPTLSFESNQIKAVGGKHQATGTLELLGEKKEITVDLEHTGAADTGRGFRSGFEANFTIKRSDFGMTYWVDSGGIGDEVEITVFIEGIRK
jgi:polyisoprenoid-binding protein YceI